ncbi:TonB-dependent receptor [Albitalea terrae]|uniref:TonB-dependent receptor n=2 Tax=Piscinibacter terrae TaxID=2496871 RepID=A0A3N7HKN4_9BURK|nr:TonB-dependent receptor [Albitalea terrae]
MGCALISLGGAGSSAWAGGEQSLPGVTIIGQSVVQVGVADSANVGVVTQKQLEDRTVYRPGELLEAAPGLIVSQHSGEGKANQFYLRGFNLDHGTDLRTTVDGMLVNTRSHAHGQGWTDLNFIIPELATGLEYKKGPYYAEEGDFSSAGAVRLKYADTLPGGRYSVSLGQDGYRRALAANSTAFADGNLLYAFEAMHNDGPFVHPDDYRKFNAVLRYSRQYGSDGGFNLTAMAYEGKWNSTDQIPQSAIDAGLISNRFDAMDPTDGGKSHRYSLSGSWRRFDENSATYANAYVIRSGLSLFSNFTYFLDDPVHGDQFAQPDDRTTTAFNVSRKWPGLLGAYETDNTVGLQFQNDSISNALQSTQARDVVSTTRADHIRETSLALYYEYGTTWNSWFRTVAGVRADSYRMSVASDNPLNSGTRSQTMANPKLSLVFGPWSGTEYYVNMGGGFHSNDARGATITVDPKDPATPASQVTPLVRSKGFELGVRTSPIPGLQTSVSLYRLDFDSELVFEGDAGTTSAGRPSRRTGFEIANYYKLSDWLTIDGDIAFARARFRDADPIGTRIPGAVEGVASLAVSVDNLGPWYGEFQWRYFGPRPLIEDNSVRSQSTIGLNGHVGYKFNDKVRIELEGFNLANRKASAIDYFYSSRLTPTGTAQDAIHFHPIEPRSFRLSLLARF